MTRPDIVETIDQALSDWTVSTDAMRWTPTRPPPPRPGTRTRLPVPRITPEQAAATLAAIGEALAPVMDAVREMCEQVGHTLARFGQAYRAANLLPDRPPQRDPRARALWLRQHRHTGPEHAPAGRQKRPRRLP